MDKTAYPDCPDYLPAGGKQATVKNVRSNEVQQAFLPVDFLNI